MLHFTTVDGIEVTYRFSIRHATLERCDVLRPGQCQCKHDQRWRCVVKRRITATVTHNHGKKVCFICLICSTDFFSATIFSDVNRASSLCYVLAEQVVCYPLQIVMWQSQLRCRTCSLFGDVFFYSLRLTKHQKTCHKRLSLNQVIGLSPVLLQPCGIYVRSCEIFGLG